MTVAVKKKVIPLYRETLESMEVGDELTFFLTTASRNSFCTIAKRIGDADERAGRPRRVYSTRLDRENRIKFYVRREK